MKHVQTALEKLDKGDLDGVQTELHALERVCRSYLARISALEKSLEKVTNDNKALMSVAVGTEQANTAIQASRNQDHQIVQKTIDTLNARDQDRMREIEGLKVELRELRGGGHAD